MLKLDSAALIKKPFYLITLFLFASLAVFIHPMEAFPVGGISNTKVIVPSAETIPKGHFEAEPGFELAFDRDGDGSTSFESSLRYTLGFSERFEAGVTVTYLTIKDTDSTDADGSFGDTAAGLKFRFMDEGRGSPFSLAYQGGITFPTNGEDDTWEFEFAGLVLTKDFSEKLSLDADAVISVIDGDEQPDAFKFVAEAGVGYFVTPWFQPVLELGYSLENPEDGSSVSIITLTGGFTAPVSEMLTIIIGISPDLYADNSDKGVAISAVFTFFF